MAAAQECPSGGCTRLLHQRTLSWPSSTRRPGLCNRQAGPASSSPHASPVGVSVSHLVGKSGVNDNVAPHGSTGRYRQLLPGSNAHIRLRQQGAGQLAQLIPGSAVQPSRNGSMHGQCGSAGVAMLVLCQRSPRPSGWPSHLCHQTRCRVKRWPCQRLQLPPRWSPACQGPQQAQRDHRRHSAATVCIVCTGDHNVVVMLEHAGPKHYQAAQLPSR